MEGLQRYQLYSPQAFYGILSESLFHVLSQRPEIKAHPTESGEKQGHDNRIEKLVKPDFRAYRRLRCPGGTDVCAGSAVGPEGWVDAGNLVL